ncbi:MAG TPA: methionine aminopeptidase [Segeticoccus sp.]|nr:methionine aminopeptidase [Segeticoccus sp.]
MAYWYNVERGRVEDDSNKSKGEDLLGPFATRAEAEGALQHAADNTERWDEEDRRWREGTDEDE